MRKMRKLRKITNYVAASRSAALTNGSPILLFRYTMFCSAVGFVRGDGREGESGGIAAIEYMDHFSGSTPIGQLKYP